MLTATATQPDINRYGVLAISGLVGLFSDRALAKLSDVADSVFKKLDKTESADPLTNPTPTLKTINPDLIQEDSKTRVILLGGGFSQNSLVYIDGNKRECIFISENEIQADITDIKANTPIKIRISNPTPGGGDSEELTWKTPPP
jgi:hypothetical protein